MMASATATAPAAPRLPPWRRPVRLRHAALVLGLCTAAWLAGVAAVVASWRTDGEAWVDVADQPLQLHLPPGLQATADIGSRFQTRLKLRPRIALPIDQTVQVELTEPLAGHARIRTEVPLDGSFSFDERIPVETDIDTLVPLRSWLPRFAVKVPIRMVVPVRITVPIRGSLPLNLNVAIDAQAVQALHVPVRTHVDMRVPIDQPLSLDIARRIGFTLLSTDQALDLHLVDSQGRWPLRNLKLERPAVEAGPPR